MFTFASFVVVGHLQACSSESALDVEALVGVAAVEDALVAANLFGDEIEGLDESEAELLALLVLGDGNVLDVADLAQAVDELVLDYQGASSHDRVLLAVGVFNDNNVVILASHHVVVLLLEFLLADVADRGQHPEAIEEARVEVGATKGSQLVALGQ